MFENFKAKRKQKQEEREQIEELRRQIAGLAWEIQNPSVNEDVDEKRKIYNDLVRSYEIISNNKTDGKGEKIVTAIITGVITLASGVALAMINAKNEEKNTILRGEIQRENMREICAWSEEHVETNAAEKEAVRQMTKW